MDVVVEHFEGEGSSSQYEMLKWSHCANDMIDIWCDVWYDIWYDTIWYDM